MLPSHSKNKDDCVWNPRDFLILLLLFQFQSEGLKENGKEKKG